MRPRTSSHAIQLGLPQLGVVFSGLLTIAVVFWAMDPYGWEDLYYRDVAIPRMQASHGFGWGAVTLRCPRTTVHTFSGVISVLPGGRLSRLGIRPGDVPWTHHGRGYAALHHALQAAERGNFSDVDVVNAQDCDVGKEEFRTVALHPRIREMPVSLAAGVLLPSPTGSQAIEVTRPLREEDSYGLWLSDLGDGDSRALWSYRDRARATWSSDGHWLAITDAPLGAPSRCLLFDIERQAHVDPLEKLPSLPVATRPSDGHDQTECEIFGWVQDEPTRVALTAFDLSAVRGQRWRFDYFFDVTTRRLIAAGSQ